MSKMSRDLLRSSNNEALEHDLDVQRKLIERMRDNQKVFYEEYKKASGISENLKDEINKIILSFRATLDDFVNKLESDEPMKNAGILIYRYNLLSNNLKKIGYITLPISQKQEFTDDLNDMVPKIEELLRYADVNNFSDIDQLKEILNSFITGTFRPVGISPIKYTQGSYIEGRSTYNELAKGLIDSYNELVMDENKAELTLQEKGEIQHEINSLKKIGTKIKSEKSITPAITKRLTESKLIAEKYIQLLFARKAQTLPQPIQEEEDQPARAVGQLFEPGFDIFAQDPQAEGERLAAQQAEADRQGVPIHYLQGATGAEAEPTPLYLASINRSDPNAEPIIKTYYEAIDAGMNKTGWDKYRNSKKKQGWEFVIKGGQGFTGLKI